MTLSREQNYGDPDLNAFKLMGPDNRLNWILAAEGLEETMRRHMKVYGDFGAQLLKWDMRANLEDFDLDSYLAVMENDGYFMKSSKAKKRRRTLNRVK